MPESERIYMSIKNDEDWPEYWRKMLWYPLVLYVCWAICNATIQFVICKDYIKRTNQLTTYTSFYAYEWSRKLMERHGPILYLILHFVYYIVSHFMAIICWHSFVFSYVMTTLWILIAFWNGACYYMDYFAKRYESSLSKYDSIRTAEEEDDRQASKKTASKDVNHKSNTKEEKATPAQNTESGKHAKTD